MARSKLKWSACFCYLLTVVSITNSIPINRNVQLSNSEIGDTRTIDNVSTNTLSTKVEEEKINENFTINESIEVTSTTSKVAVPDTDKLVRNNLRPGLNIQTYQVELTIDGENFDGRVLITATLQNSDDDDSIILHAAGLNIQRVMTGINENLLQDAGFNVDDDELEIDPATTLSFYYIMIEYSGNIGNSGIGLYSGDDSNYLAINLNPTNARRVFPCIDELTEMPRITFTINGVPHNNLISNTVQQNNDDGRVTYESFSGPPKQWAFVGHDYTTYNVPTQNVLLYGRQGLQGQDSQASLAINSYFESISEWLDKDYFEILVNQANNMHIIAFPDLANEWHSLSIIGIWEPYVFMEQPQHAVKQRQVALVKIAEAISRPWLGYALYPENWKYQWIGSGLTTYVAYEIAKEFQPAGEGLLDYDTLFVTEVIQEGLYWDAYTTAPFIEPDDLIFDENDIRLHLHDLQSNKAAAIMYTLRNTVSSDDDIIQLTAQNLITNNAINGYNSRNFLDTMNALMPSESIVGDLEDFIVPYLKQNGCPLLTVTLQSGLITISRSTFKYETTDPSNFFIPLTYTTSSQANFDDVFPTSIYDAPVNVIIPENLGEDDWIIFNLQGRGYYRVQYSNNLWERLINALDDPDRRSEIHPLNRATLLDDSFNLARRISGGLEYEYALQIALTMQHEIEYAPWRAFIRNFNFIKKRLEALLDDDEDEEYDPDIYLRMVRRTLVAVEDELGFSPEVNINEPAMTTLTRGMVMDYACRGGYVPCIAAAIDWFYNANGEVNLNIPHDLRPAVFCSVVREGDEEVRDMLLELLDDETRTRNAYDRLVILEALACSQDGDFIDSYLVDTIDPESSYTIEERSRIFTAIVESSYSNAGRVLNFMMGRTDEIRQRYGGSAKLEEMLFVLADNLVDNGMVSDFADWIDSSNDLGESEGAAMIALERANSNQAWSDTHLAEVYQWIDENDATTTALSMFLLSLIFFVHWLK